MSIFFWCFWILMNFWYLVNLVFYSGGSLGVEGVLGGLVGGGVLIVGMNYAKIHNLNKKYREMLESVETAEQLERLDDVFDNLGRGVLLSGQRVLVCHRLSHKYNSYLYTKQRENVFGV